MMMVVNLISCLVIHEYIYSGVLKKMSEWYLNKSSLQILSKAPKNAKRPISSDVVTIKVEGKLEDGTKVDVFESLTFVLGDGDVIQGIRVKVFKTFHLLSIRLDFTDIMYMYHPKLYLVKHLSLTHTCNMYS